MSSLAFIRVGRCRSSIRLAIRALILIKKSHIGYTHPPKLIKIQPIRTKLENINYTISNQGLVAIHQQLSYSKHRRYIPIVIDINDYEDFRICRTGRSRIICIQSPKDKPVLIDKNLIHLVYQWSGQDQDIKTEAVKLANKLIYQTTAELLDRLNYQRFKICTSNVDINKIVI